MATLPPLSAAAAAPNAVAAPRGEVLWTVQALRGLAALLIVIGHAQSNAAYRALAAGRDFDRWSPVPWGASVDLFFVISGFVIVHAARRLFGRPGAWRPFLVRRVVRVVPLYWLATSLYLLLLAAAAWKGGGAPPPAGWAIASYLFLPSTAPAGGVFPVIELGWTLQYEMLFYGLMALAVGWPRGRAIALLLALIAALVAIGTTRPAGVALHFWTRPILVDFALGVGVGAAFGSAIRLPSWLRILLAIGGVIWFAADPLHAFAVPLGSTVDNGWPRVAMAGVPAAMVLAAAILGPEPRRPAALGWATHLGDASYALYLFHPFALILMEKIVQKSMTIAALPQSAIVITAILLAVLLALVVHRAIERPLLALRRRGLGA